MRMSRDMFFGLWAQQNLMSGGTKNRKMPFDLGKVGGLLKSAREEKGLTYEEITGALLIRKQVINAIESGDWAVLPSMVYVKGYITQYASFLDILDQVQPELPLGEGPLSVAVRQS
jgi:DNA-binding XRE family transcriptional regulator